MSEKYEERVFDYLVEEMLYGPEPPDLSARIEAAWMQEKDAKSTAGGLTAEKDSAVKDESPSEPTADLTSRNQVVAEVVAEAVDKTVVGQQASTKQSNISHSNTASARPRSHASPGSRTNSPSSKNSNAEHNSARTARIVAAGLAIAATAVLMVIGYRAYLNRDTVEVVANDSSNQGNIASNGPGEKDRPDGRPDPSTLADQGTAEIPGEALDLDDLPFDAAAETPEAKVIPENIVQQDIRTEPVRKLEDRAFVDRVNLQLSAMWKGLGIEPTESLPVEQRAAKIYRKLTGEDVGSLAELATQGAKSGSEGLSDFDSLAFAQSIVAEDTYAKHWADQITRQWLRSSAMPLNSAQVDVFERYLANGLAAGGSWNGVVADVIGGPLDKELKQPSSVFWAALAGNGNHRLVNRLGTNFLNSNLACARCHDVGPGGTPSADPVDQFAAQRTYWSLVAMVKGIEAKGNGNQGERQLIDGQQASLSEGSSLSMFYDRLDGVLEVAKAGLPDGGAWSEIGETPRKALAVWLEDASAMDEAVVNQTWKLVFGRHLVPQVDGIDVVASQNRHELLSELSAQYRAHGRDLSKLVTWLVSADAFALQPALQTRAEWLDASEQELGRYRLAELAFAAEGSLSNGQEANNLESSLAVVLKWSSSQPMLNGKDVSLAQPDPSIARKRKPGQPETVNKPQAPPLSYAIHGERFTKAEVDFVDRLLNSPRLRWEDRVAHIVAVNEYENANGKLQKLAKEILQQKQGDARAALLSLLWAVRNSH